VARRGVRIQTNLAPWEEAVATEDLFRLRVPYDELIIGVFARVKLVPVERRARSAACFSESDFAQATYLAQHVGSLLIGDDVYFVSCLIG